MDELDTRLTDIQPLLQLISRERMMDFSVYNQPMLLRSIQLRQMQRGQPDIAAYLTYLNDNPAEIDLLLNTILITVSHFFRNILTFACLRERVIPVLVTTAPPGGLRIWCAGCAQGDEAYSVAILLKEWCQRESVTLPIFIIATDIDDAALAWGRVHSVAAVAFDSAHMDKL